MKYVSEITGEIYNTPEEVEKAEKLYQEKQKKEDEKKAQRKERAEEVQEAFKEVEKAREKANDLLADFINDYGSFHMSIDEPNYKKRLDIKRYGTSLFF